MSPKQCKYLKTSVILVMVCGIFNIATLNWLLIEHQHKTLKRKFEKQIKAGIPGDQLVVFRVDEANAHQMQWIDEKEFTFHGEYYDVVDVTMDSGVKVIRCISDKAEHEIEEMAEEMAKRSERNDDGMLILLKYIPEYQQTYLEVETSMPEYKFPLHIEAIDRFRFRFQPQPPDFFI